MRTFDTKGELDLICTEPTIEHLMYLFNSIYLIPVFENNYETWIQLPLFGNYFMLHIFVWEVPW